MSAADGLGVVRLLAVAIFPWTLRHALDAGAERWLPLALVVLAAATDFFDGVLARRAGRTTRHGALLDNAADIAFVLAVTGSGAARGLVPWHAPAAIALAFGTYLVASWRASRGPWRPARSAMGHAAGVLNYVLAGLVAGAVAVPHPATARAAWIVGLLVAGVNVAAVLDRAAGRRRA